ncbi:MAG: hypothetical protein NZP34_06700, partial [Caldilineales bacterium]|nr:hypothetical protein [Caldilineales bacterium]
RRQLVAEASVTLEAIRRLAPPDVADPFTDPVTLARAVTSGVLDAPQLRNNPFGRGRVRTAIIGGACVAVDQAGNPLSEAARLRAFLEDMA